MICGIQTLSILQGSWLKIQTLGIPYDVLLEACLWPREIIGYMGIYTWTFRFGCHMLLLIYHPLRFKLAPSEGANDYF